jgi:hypothetical protein
VFDWLFDGVLPISLVLGAATLGLAWAWYRTNQSTFAYGFFFFLIVLLIYLTLHFFVETTSEQIERKIHAMVAGVDQKNVDKIFEHISDRFEYTQGTTKLNKMELRNYAVEALRRPELHGMIVHDVSTGPIDRDAGKAPVFFTIKILGPSDRESLLLQVESEFTLDPDKQWRMKTFKLFRPFGEHNDPVPLPIR